MSATTPAPAPRKHRKSPRRTEPTVPVELLQEALQRRLDEGWTYNDVAAWAGLVTANGMGDGSHLKRILGLAIQPQRKGYDGYYNRQVGEKNAKRIIIALGLFPRDFGI